MVPLLSGLNRMRQLQQSRRVSSQMKSVAPAARVQKKMPGSSSLKVGPASLSVPVGSPKIKVENTKPVPLIKGKDTNAKQRLKIYSQHIIPAVKTPAQMKTMLPESESSGINTKVKPTPSLNYGSDSTATNMTAFVRRVFGANRLPKLVPRNYWDKTWSSWYVCNKCHNLMSS